MGRSKSKPAKRRPSGGFEESATILRKAAISAFVLWQLLMVTFWLMPDSATQRFLLRTLRDYMWATGSDQNWNMFSPNPASTDVYMSALITYQDGTQKTWLFPRMHNLGVVQKYQQERFRKFIENAHLDANSAVWPYAARFAAI